MPQELASKRKQNIILENCEKLFLSGVQTVISFDEEAMSLQTDNGRLEIRGRDMKITSFDTQGGDMLVSGYVYAIVYREESARGGFLKRMFS